MRRVLVLRPEPAASETVARARELGLDAEAQPLFEVEPVTWDAPEAGRFDGLLLTSANAVRHGGEQLAQLRGLPVYAVGEATAAVAREAGFDIKKVGGAGADRLLGSIEPGLKLLHLGGVHRTASAAATHEILAIPVYRSREREISLGNVAGAVALVHSPRAGRRFAELVGDRATIAIAAISPAAAQAAGDGWSEIAAADTPTDAAVLALAARLCKTSPPK